MYASASTSRSTLERRATLTLGQCRIRASFLLKDLVAADAARARRAAERFRILPDFAALDVTRILAWRSDIRRKHALAVIAAELGYRSWSALKARLDVTIPVIVPLRLFGRLTGGFLNRWYRRYEEAREGQRARPGVLFPHRDHFVVCDPEFLSALGLDPADPDWDRIGWDWVQPRDTAAFRRLAWKLEALGLATTDASAPAAPTPPSIVADVTERRPAGDSRTSEDEDATAAQSPTLAVGRTVLLVRDYEEALRFYRDAVGLEILHDEMTLDGQRLLHVGTYRHGVLASVGLWLLKPTGEDEALIGRQAGQHPLLVIYTDDCAAAYARLSARGVRFAKPPAVLGASVVAPFLDLYGNKVVLVQLQANE